MSTHNSACLDSSPASKRLGPSAQMSAISASSASESCVQSLVSTSIAMSRGAPEGSQTVLLVQRGFCRACNSARRFEQVGSLSAYQCIGAEQHSKFTHESVR